MKRDRYLPNRSWELCDGVLLRQVCSKLDPPPPPTDPSTSQPRGRALNVQRQLHTFPGWPHIWPPNGRSPTTDRHLRGTQTYNGPRTGMHWKGRDLGGGP